MPKHKTTETKVEFRIFEIKKISHLEKDFKEYGLTEEDLKSGNVDVTFNFGVDNDKAILSYNIVATFLLKTERQIIELFSLESLHKFQIRNFNEVIVGKKENEFTIPDIVMIKLLNISIAGTRGMLVALNTNPAYKNIYLPLIDSNKVLNSLTHKPKEKI